MLLHQIWFQGADKAPAKDAANRASWRRNHPDAEIRTWDAASIEALIDKHYPEWRFLYDLMPLMIQKIDMGKVFIMHQYGGSYVDMDTESLRPLDAFVLDAGLTFSYVNSTPFEHCVLGALRGVEARAFVNNGIMISPQAKDPFWIYYLERLRLEMCPREGPRKHTLLERLCESVYVMNTTGPLLWTDAVHAWNREHPGSIRILHYSYLEPIFGRDPPHLKKTYPWSYVKHDHASSWVRKDPMVIRLLNVYYHWIRPYWWMLLLVIFVLPLLLIF